MSAAEGRDLTGRWSGFYSYPAHYEPNMFEATIREHRGAFAGETSETDPHRPGPLLLAMIEGTRTDSEVRFTKIYDDAARAPDPILYQGTLAPDGNEIEGRWEIPGVWSGTFLMVRGAGSAEALEVEENVAVPL